MSIPGIVVIAAFCVILLFGAFYTSSRRVPGILRPFGEAISVLVAFVAVVVVAFVAFALLKYLPGTEANIQMNSWNQLPPREQYFWIVYAPLALSCFVIPILAFFLSLGNRKA